MNSVSRVFSLFYSKVFYFGYLNRLFTHIMFVAAIICAKCNQEKGIRPIGIFSYVFFYNLYMSVWLTNLWLT